MPAHNKGLIDGVSPRQKDDLAAYHNLVRRKRITIFILSAMLFAVFLLALNSGTAQLSLTELFAALADPAATQTRLIVLNIRLPRVLTGLVAGAGLAITGCVMQSVLRNPLASASTLGVSQGAAFGASIGLTLLGTGSAIALLEGGGLRGPYLVSLCAFLASMVATLVILALSRLGKVSPEGMILCGVALSALFSGGTALIQYFSDEQRLTSIVFWTFGDLGRTSLNDIGLMAAVVGMGAIFFFHNRWNYSAMLTGDDSARGLGVDIDRSRLQTMTVATLVTAVIVAFIGIINFIGLIAPHILRRFLGHDHRFLIPGSALLGATLLLLSDILARTLVQPLVLPIGAITSFLGAPLFLYMLYRGTQKT